MGELFVVKSSACMALLGLAFMTTSAAAQTPTAAQAPGAAPMARAYPDLPMERDKSGRDLVPGVGPTAGVILEVISPRAKCSRDAIKAADGLMAPRDAIVTCNEAITLPSALREDVAGAHVNRGVLLLTMLQADDAKRDFERAIELNPDSAEALANRGSMKVTDGKPAEAVADLDRAIALGTQRPARAYYARALAREDLGYIRGAYEDFVMAQSLEPTWTEPTAQLTRYQVRQR